MLRIVPAGTITAGTSHTFDAPNLRDLAAAMAGLAEVGHADFDLALAFATDGGNRLTNVDLTMTLTIDMPIWNQASSRPDPEKNEWNRFLRALRAHEDGHIAICRAEAPTTYDKLTKATPATINDVLEAERLRIKRLNDAYDTRNGHGTRQQTAHGSTTITVP